MNVDSNVARTVAFLRAQLPLDLYVTLGQGPTGQPLAAKARLCDVVDEDQTRDRGSSHRYKNRVGVRILHNGVMHHTLCAAGKAMRSSLRVRLYNADTGAATFDSWHRTKVCYHGKIYRMKELIPPAARRGETAVTGPTFLQAAPLERRDHHLHQVLHAGRKHTVLDGTVEDRSCKRQRITVVAPIKIEPAAEALPKMSVRDPRQLAMVEQSMTMLRETFPSIQTPQQMLDHIQALASEQLARMGVPRAIWTLALKK